MERLERRAHATGLRWVALSLVGLGVVAAACSSDSSSPGEMTAGQAGDGANNGGKGGSSSTAGGGSGGKSSTAGTASMTGGAAGEVSDGGASGAPPMVTLGEQCTTCGATACADTMKTCNDNAECTAWLGCLAACNSSDCVSSCDDTFADAARLYTGVYACLCTSCTDACTGADACGKKTCVDDNPLPVSGAIPKTLAETGLYELVDGAGGAGGAGGAASVDLAMPLAIASNVKTYEPKYPLWADGATKQRYVYIPKCATINNTDPDHWSFPVGTRFWKQFTVEGKIVETRMMEHFGTGEADWSFAAYQWDESKPTDPTAALSVPAGVVNANGTTHDIPPGNACNNCHTKLTERVLGFGSIQLSHDPIGKDVAIKKISELGWLTTPAPDGFPVPGTPAQQAALGYLHGNCGGCHNQSVGIPNNVSPLVLRLLVGKSYAMSGAVTTAVGVPVVSGNPGIAGKDRIHAMDPDNSAILIRMGGAARGTALQMPPQSTDSTKEADTNGGIKVVTDWVNSLP